MSASRDTIVCYRFAFAYWRLFLRSQYRLEHIGTHGQSVSWLSCDVYLTVVYSNRNEGQNLIALLRFVVCWRVFSFLVQPFKTMMWQIHEFFFLNRLYSRIQSPFTLSNVNELITVVCFLLFQWFRLVAPSFCYFHVACIIVHRYILVAWTFHGSNEPFVGFMILIMLKIWQLFICRINS